MDYQKIDNWREHNELKGLIGLKPPVKEIWFRGQWEAKILENCVTVVGARRMTEYGKRVLEKLIPQLVFEKKTIVSGFMYGVDQYAHNLAIENGGKTVAVLGWGIGNQIPDIRDQKLAQRILESGGLVISEWEKQISARWTFPVRDRILAALSQETYVIEAGLKSGSLITANWAVKLNRKLWAVPGPVTSRVSAGTNWLIDSGKAKMWLGENNQEPNSKNQTNSKDPITKILNSEALTVDEVARKLGKPVQEVGAQLSLLTLTGKLKERSGKYYVE